MSILEYNGGGVVAMVGDGCVAIACDTRYGIQQRFLSANFPKVFAATERCLVGFPGLITDMQTVRAKLSFRAKLYKLREEREMSPQVVGNVLSTMLYERRFGPYFVEPLVAGITDDGKPYITAMDLLGADASAPDFVVGGSCGENLYGVCESLYRPGLGADELFEVAAQCLLSAVDRDAYTGWGASVWVMTKEKCVKRDIRVRQD